MNALSKETNERAKSDALPIVDRWESIERLRIFLKNQLSPNTIRLISRLLRPQRTVRSGLDRWSRRRRLLSPAVHRAYGRQWAEARARWSAGVTEPTGPSIELPVTPHGPLVTLRPGTSDILVYEDVIVQERYGRVPLHSARTIVDCGANIGLTSAYLLARYPESRVLALESDPLNYEICQQNLAPFGDRARVVNAALWGTCSDMTIAGSSKRGTWASKVEPVGSNATTGDYVVRGIDMPGLMAEYDIEFIDILKIDIEGAEADVFGVSDLHWLARVHCLMIELENQETEAIFFKAVEDQPLSFFRTGDVTIALRHRAT